MNRKLTNSLFALAATGAVLVVTVVFGLNPLSPDGSLEPVLAATDGPQLPGDDGPPAPLPASRAEGGGMGQLTRSLAMPYFSFVPRG